MLIYGMKQEYLSGRSEFKEGVEAPVIKGELKKKENIESDVLKTYIND